MARRKWTLDELNQTRYCSRCNRPWPVANWPGGSVCGHCYQGAKRTRGTCVSCGHVGVLPGRTPAGNTCRTCSGIQLNVDCVRCGIEDELYSQSRCWRCTLSDLVDQALSGTDGAIQPELLPIADALKGMSRANSGVTWIRQPHVHNLLRQLASGHIELSHEALDQLPRSKTLTYIQDLLVEHQVLPARDRHLAGYERWLAEKLEKIEDQEQRKIIERFGRWHHLRRLRSSGKPISHSAFLNAKQSTTVAITFLVWLAQHNKQLHEATQADLDEWIATGSSTNTRIDSFLYWARSHRMVGDLDIPSHHRGNGPILDQQARIDAIRRVLLDDTTPLPTRVAAGLVLLYGQPVNRVSAVLIEQIAITDDCVTIRFGPDELTVPEPFATLLATLHGSRMNLQTAAHRNSPWLFPGSAPGQHLNATHLSDELRRHGAPPLASRTGALQQLVREIPPSILADALGISPITAMKHADLAGADYLRYAGLRTRASADRKNED